MMCQTTTWHTAVDADRLRALADTDPGDVRIQPVDAGCWRVIDAAAAWGDPWMLLGFIQATPAGFECTLMATLQEHQRVASLGAAREFFSDACGPLRGPA